MGLASIGHRLVADEDVDRSLSGRDQVEEGKSLSSLRVLGDPMNAGGMVETVARPIVNRKTRPG